MSAKFTPGPWFVVPQGCFVADRKVEFDGDGARVGETPNMCIECASEANAHLIAAAPEMYEVIEEIAGMKIADCDAHDAANYMRDAARALLAKMRGEA